MHSYACKLNDKLCKNSVFMTQTPPYNGFQAYGGKGALTESWHRGRGLHGVGVGLFVLARGGLHAARVSDFDFFCTM
jgi:hypothetical protein